MLVVLSLQAPCCRAPLARRQPCRAALQPPQPVRHARIFWDLDNINAKSCEHTLVLGHRLRSSVRRLTGLPAAQHVGLSAFANEATVERLRLSSREQSWEAVLELLGVDVVVAGLGKDAADLHMRHSMLQYAQQHGAGAAVVCVSNDQGYAPALQRCSQMGCFTVAVGTYLREAGFNWSTEPSKLPLPSAANAIVAWHPGRVPLQSKKENRLLASLERRVCQDSHAAIPAQLYRKKHKGLCCAAWLNPSKPQLQQL